MSRRRNFTLNETELEVVEEAIRSHSDADIVKQAVALHLLHLGQYPEEVAKTLLVNPSTVSNWCRRWAAEGLEGLVDLAKRTKTIAGS